MPEHPPELRRIGQARDTRADTTFVDASTPDLERRLREAERRAYEAEAAYETLLEQVPGAIYAYAPEFGGPTLSMSAYIDDLLGVPAERFLSGDAVWDELLHPDDRDRAWADYESFLRTGSPDAGDYRYIRPDGRVVWIHDRSAIVRDRDGTPLLVQGVMFDITATKETALRMQHMAFHDNLTGLPNRAMFQEHLELALARARRHDLAVAVLFLDLDDFKPVNDTHGHEVGDEVLQHAARRIRGAARDTDLVARQGGDEFLVMIADIDAGTGGEAAMGVAREASDRIAGSIAEPIKVAGTKLSVRASIGCALFPFGAGDARSLLRLADEDMYARKRERFDPATGIRRLASGPFAPASPTRIERRTVM
jgi:diguanylate cyclase (GGDEF)-like protein/PAS domain S-box-containing protein